MPLKDRKSNHNSNSQKISAVRKPAAEKFSFSASLLDEDLTVLTDSVIITHNPSENPTKMDHYFARKKFDSELDEDKLNNENEWNDNQSTSSSNHTFIENETQNNNSGLWAGYFETDPDWPDNGESLDLNKSSSYEDYPSSRDRSFERSPDGRVAKRKSPQEEYFQRVSSSRRPDGLDLMKSYQPTPSRLEPKLSKSFNESMMPSYDRDSDEQSQEDETRNRKAYRKKVETHYKKLVENKVMTPESEILNQSWSSVDARVTGIGGTDSPSYKIGVDESHWREIDHQRSLSLERERSNSHLGMYPEDMPAASGRGWVEDNVNVAGNLDGRIRGESREYSPEHKSPETTKKKVRVRRHDSLIKYGSEPDLSSRPRAEPVLDISQSQESFHNYSFNEGDHQANGFDEQESFTDDYNSETGERNYAGRESSGFYKDQSDYYKTLPRGRVANVSAKQDNHEVGSSHNLSRPRSTPNLTTSKRHQLFPESDGGGHYPWKYVPHPKQQQVDNFYAHFARRDPSESSDRSSRLDPQTYQSYAAGILHSSRKSEQFLKLQQRYAMLERIAEIEEGTLASNEILGRRNYNVINPQLMKSRSASRSLGNVSRDDSIVDYLLLSKYKLENLEELKDLYAELQEAQDKDEFFYDAGKVQEHQWSPFDDFGLALKETNISDLYSIFEMGHPNLNTKSFRKRHKKVTPDDFRRDLSYKKLKDKYKHMDEESRKQRMMADFWRMKFGRGRRDSNASVTSATSTATQGSISYLQIMENVTRKSKERPLYGYNIDENRNSYDQYIEKIKRSRSVPNVSRNADEAADSKSNPVKKDIAASSRSKPRPVSNNGNLGTNSPDGLGRQRASLNGGLRPPSGRSSESGYDSVERDLHKISKEPAKALEELWDIIDGKNSLQTKKYKDILKNQKVVGRHEEITVAYGSYERGHGNKGTGGSSSKGASGTTPKPVVSCFGNKGKPDPDYDYPDGIPGNIKRTKYQGSKHSPPSQGPGQGDPWRSEVRGVVGVEASGGDKPDVSRDRKLAQGGEFDRYLGNDAISSSQKRYENFKVNRSWRKDSKPQPGAVHAALTRLSSQGELGHPPIREQREPPNYQPAKNKDTYNRSSSHRESDFSYYDRDTGSQRIRKSHTFELDKSRGRFDSDYRQQKYGDQDRSNRFGSEYSDRDRDSGFDSRYRVSGPSFLDVRRDRDNRSSRLDKFEGKDNRLAATGMRSREVNPEAFQNAKSRFESPWPEDENVPRTAFSGQSTRTPLGRYEAKIRSRSESPSRARPKSAEPPKSRTEYRYEPFTGGNVRDNEYGTMVKSNPFLHNKGREWDVTKSNTGVTLKYDPKTGKVSDPLDGAHGRDYGRCVDDKRPYDPEYHASNNKHENKWGLQIPPGTNRPGANLNISSYERRPDGQSTPSQQSTTNNTYHKSTDRTEHHMKLEDSDRSHKSLEPVRLNLLTSPSTVLPSRDETDGRLAHMDSRHYGSDYSNRERSLNDLSKFNRTPKPFVSSYGQDRGAGFKSRNTDFPNLSEFREEIKREVTGKEKSPPESEDQDMRPSKPPRSWSTSVAASQESLNESDFGGRGRWSGMNMSDGLNRPRAGDRDPGPEPGKLQKWNTSNLAQTSSLGSSNDTLIIKGSDPDLTEHPHNRTFESVKQMKNVLAKNLEKARSEPDMMRIVDNVGTDSPRGSKSEENVQETTRSANFHEIRAKYEAESRSSKDGSTRPVPRTVSGDLKDIRDKYNKGEAFKNREWEQNEPQTPKTPLCAPMPFMAIPKQHSARPPGYPPRKNTPPLPPKDSRKNYNTSPIVEQVQRLISNDDVSNQERERTADQRVRAKKHIPGIWDVMRPYSPSAHEISAKMLDNLNTIENEWQKEKNKNVYAREIVMRPDSQSSPAPSSIHTQYSYQSQSIPNTGYRNQGVQQSLSYLPHMSTSRSSPALSNTQYLYDTYTTQHEHYPDTMHLPSTHYKKHYTSLQQQYSQHPSQYLPHNTQQQHNQYHEEPEYSTIDRRQKQIDRQQRMQQQQQQQLHPHLQQPQQPHYAAREARITNTNHPEAVVQKSQSHGSLYSTHAQPHPRYEYQPVESNKDFGHVSREYHGDVQYHQSSSRSAVASIPRPKSAMAGLVKYTDPQYHVYTAQSRQVHPSGDYGTINS